MNLVSRSHGKEPNRQLHLKKKPRQLASQSFQVTLCDEIYNELQDFDKKFGKLIFYISNKTKSPTKK